MVSLWIIYDGIYIDAQMRTMVLVYLPTKLAHKNGVNVGKYTIHGAHGMGFTMGFIDID